MGIKEKRRIRTRSQVQRQRKAGEGEMWYGKVRTLSVEKAATIGFASIFVGLHSFTQ